MQVDYMNMFMYLRFFSCLVFIIQTVHRSTNSLSPHTYMYIHINTIHADMSVCIHCRYQNIHHRSPSPFCDARGDPAGEA